MSDGNVNTCSSAIGLICFGSESPVSLSEGSRESFLTKKSCQEAPQKIALQPFRLKKTLVVV